MVLSVVPPGLVAVANAEAGRQISAAGWANLAAVSGAVAAAVGPIAATVLAGCAPAQANNLAGALLVAGVHTAIGAARMPRLASIVSADDA
jgi:hypothetical protein